MAEFIVMPKLGFDMREGVLNQWLKNVGDPVSRGEVVAEIESDKATLDLEAQANGILLHLIEKGGNLQQSEEGYLESFMWLLDDDERSEFLDWYEKMFLRMIKQTDTREDE